MTTVLSLVLAVAALASEVDVAVVDVTAPTGSVTLAPAASGSIAINLSVTGAQAGTATFEVYRNWTLSGGAFVGSNPQEFTVGPRAGGDPATTFSTTGVVSVAAGQADGTFTLAVGAFDITNSNTTGAKLAAGDASTYAVTVTTPLPSDTTPPVITPNVTGTLGTNGWYTGNVTLTWTVTENESPSSLVKTGCVDQNITADQAATTYNCSASSTGGSAGPETISIKRDGTAPTVAYTSAAPAVAGGGPNGAGWYRSDVVATFTATDNLSGFNGAGDLTETGTNTTSGEGNAVTVGSPAFTDWAGNSVAADAATSDAFKIDKTAPSVSVTGVSNGATYTLGSVPAAGCSAVETLSGIKTATSLSTSGGPVGSITATCSAATDNADNTGSPASVTYSVVYNWNGFFRPVDNGGVFNVVKAGSAIPMKFSLSGNQGLSIFAPGAPISLRMIPCDSTATFDQLEETVTAGNSVLSYDALADQYNYVWKTDKLWAGSCRQFSMALNDGTTHTANFKFTK